MGISIPTLFDVTNDEVRPMSEDEAKHFVAINLAQRMRPSKVVSGKDLRAEFMAHYKTDALPFQLDVGISRIEACDPEGEFDLDMVMWAFGVLSDRVGVVVLWAYALSKGRQKVNGQAITLDHWARQMHPNGPPTKDAITRIWDAQKGHVLGLKCDNYLDTKEAWA